MAAEGVIDLTSDVAEGDEIIVENEKVPLLKQYSEWIQDSQHVKLVFGKVVNDDNGIQRWIQFEGDTENKKKAKDYVRSLCNAASEVKMKYPAELHALLTNSTVRSRLEVHSGAVLKFTKKPGEVIILGLDPLPVTLAMSALEDIINKHMDLEENSPKKSEASARLDKELRRLSSEEGHNVLNDDYSETNDAVKRTILSWMREESFDDSEEKMELGGAIQQFEQIQLEHVGQQIADCSSSDEYDSVDGVALKPSDTEWSEETRELYNFAKKVGYSDVQIETVFNEHGKDLSAGEFINKLVTKFGKKTTQVAETSAEPEIRPEQLEHLGGYLQERLDHDRQETGITDVELLKRNNKKRQEALKQAFAQREKQEEARRDSDDVIYVGENSTNHKRHQHFNSPKQKHKKKNRKKANNSDASSSQSPRRTDETISPETISGTSGGQSAVGPSPAVTDLTLNGGVSRAQVKSSYTDQPSTSSGATVKKIGMASDGAASLETVGKTQEGQARQLEGKVRQPSGPTGQSVGDIELLTGGHMQIAGPPGAFFGGPRHIPGGPALLPAGSGQIPGGPGQIPGGSPFLPAASGQIPGASGQLPGGPGQIPGGPEQIPGGSGQIQGGPRQIPGGPGPIPGGSGQLLGGPEQIPGGSGQFSSGARPREANPASRLNYIVIDGSNVAMSHGNGRIFSCKGIQICVDYFKKRGHTEVTVFVPQWRTRAPTPNNPISHQGLLEELKQQGHLVYTPARRVPGKSIVCYDDKFIVRLAHETGGIMVSNDNYRDLWQEKPEWRHIIERRLTGYSFVGDIFMLPDDPLGRNGPTLEQFLTKEAFWTRSNMNPAQQSGQTTAPYVRPSNPHQYSLPRPNWHQQHQPQHQPQQQQQHQPQHQHQPQATGEWQQVPVRHRPPNRQNPHTSQPQPGTSQKHRSQSQTEVLYKQLEKIFEGNERRVLEVLDKNKSVHDVNTLSSLILDGM